MSALIDVSALKKTFGERRLLDVSELALDAGKIYALTGDNGSGKSTLLKILSGLEPADELRMRFNGEDIDGATYPDALRREIIYVHQHPYLFHSSIAANIEYGLTLRGVAQPRRLELANAAIEWAGLGAVRQVQPKRLSGGERQKVALARAKVLTPRLLLVDEPTANLDRAACEQIVALLKQTASDNNCVVVACHDREIIELPGVVRLHLEDGRLSELS